MLKLKEVSLLLKYCKCLLPLSEDLFRDITWYDEPVECEIVAKGTSQKQWVDMKDATPPKESDKKKHLLLFKDGTVCIGRWSAANQLFRNEDIWELHKTNVTHWMAIPDVPELF